ncbi:uncharacterized protein LOC104914411 isoform X2 [Meleagris gallopavo]|uniref:uncharacterized protein LOC104914411 isoform X2 n=1 Tax=Meleagris gallopavo TaxID=9103 RepID=UPI000549DF66|nr:uncharacterized protein LOC104914411 isoform X2 [Meleagris gallopavo]
MFGTTSDTAAAQKQCVSGHHSPSEQGKKSTVPGSGEEKLRHLQGYCSQKSWLQHHRAQPHGLEVCRKGPPGMARAGAVLFSCVLLVMAGGLQCCHAIKILRGKRGKPLSFPALRPVAKDIVRITWTSETHSTHIAEAKPEVKEFAVDFLPDFQGRLRIHPQLLSLEITELRSTDADDSPGSADSDTGGPSRSTAGPGMSSEPYAGGGTTPGPGNGQLPDAGGSPGPCGAQGGYCILRGYLVAAVFGPLVILLVVVHVVTRH